MNTTMRSNFTSLPSARAHQRMSSQRGEPLFIAAWHNALMIHFEVNAATLQRDVPFELDLWNGKAFVSLVAFTMLNMRPHRGGKLAALLFRPIATHNFLNVRTYVRQGDVCGIHFMAEWLTNRLAVLLGPSTFGLPYHYGHISYQGDLKKGCISGRIVDPNNRTALTFDARLTNATAFQPCIAGSLDEWLMERYVAFNSANRIKRFFRVWHPAWPQRPAEARLGEKSLLTSNWPWFNQALLVGANFSPGFDTVWMSRPYQIPSINGQHPCNLPKCCDPVADLLQIC